MSEKNLKEKDIYKLFNEVKIEESEFEDIDNESKIQVLSIHKERIKKNLKKKIKIKKKFKKIKYSIIAAAISFVCLLGVGMFSPTFAQNIPILNSVIQSLNGGYGDHGEYDKYSQIVNKSVTDKGVTLTINEALADDSKLIIGYTVKSNKKIIGKFNGLLNIELIIDGKNRYGGGNGSGAFINDYTFVSSKEYDIRKLELGEKLNIDLNISGIIGEVKSNWNFTFNMSKDELVKKSAIFKLNKKIDFSDSKISIDEVSFSPIGTYISISGKHKENDRLKSIGIMEYDYWIVFDDKGVELAPKTLGGGDSNSSNFTSKMEYTKVNYIPRYLTIVPCKITSSEEYWAEDGKVTIKKNKEEKEISKFIDGAYPIELPQGKFGKLIIKEIKAENNKTIVKYAAEGKAPYYQGSNLYLKDSNGNRINSKNRDIRKDEEKPNEFTMEFEALSGNKEYKICTTNLENIEFGENSKFKIELNKE